jgi:hypothetical protein
MKKLLFAAALMWAALTAPADAGTRRAIPGGMFADALTSGEFACPAGGAIVTHAGLVPMPIGSGGVFFTRITNVGGFKIAEKSHDTDHALVWNGAWSDTGQISHGTQGHIWTDTGELFVHAPCADCDSQGIRWWEPGVGPIYGSPTYNPFTLFAIAKNVRLIYEWTCRGDICAGQGEDSGAVLQYRGKHYVLEPGDARFIQFHRDGDALAVAITKFREKEAVIWWLSVGEIEALPLYVPTAPAPAPTPTPVPAPAPAPQPSQKKIVEEIRRKYPTPLREHHWEFLVEVAQATRNASGEPCKLFQKDAGDRIFVPPLNLSVSQDILICEPQWIDILGDGENAATPDWSAHDNAGEPKKWIDVSGIDLTGSHQPPPPPAPTDIEKLRARVTELEKQLADAQGRLAEFRDIHLREWEQISELQQRQRELEAERDDLEAQLEAERSKPATRCEVRGVPSWARKLGVRASCVVIQ